MSHIAAGLSQTHVAAKQSSSPTKETQENVKLGFARLWIRPEGIIARMSCLV